MLFVCYCNLNIEFESYSRIHIFHLKGKRHQNLPTFFFANRNLLQKSERTEKHQKILIFDKMRAC